MQSLDAFKHFLYLRAVGSNQIILFQIILNFIFYFWAQGEREKGEETKRAIPKENLFKLISIFIKIE